MNGGIQSADALIMSAFRILIVGGGIAGLEAGLALRGLGGDGVAPTLVSPGFEFSMHTHGLGTPRAGRRMPSVPLEEILHGLDIGHVGGIASGVETDARRVRLLTGEVLDYDGLLLAIGGVPFPAFAHGVTFERPGDPAAFEELLKEVDLGLVEDVAFVVPDATIWALPAYELALALRAWAQRHARRVRVRVVTAEDSPLELFGAAAATAVRAALERADIGLVAGSAPIVISDTTMLAGGRWVTAGRIVALPRVAGPRLRGVPCDADGFILVDADGGIAGCRGAFAVGDAAAQDRRQGGLAAQQADRAARCLLRQADIAVAAPDPHSVLRGVLITPDGPLFLRSTGAWGLPGAESAASFTPLWDQPTDVVTRWLGPHLEGVMQRRLGALAA
jgi:sulfide:quinone oxidoreductase